MVQANELRIGNWILVSNRKGKEYQYKLDAVDLVELVKNSQDFSPIPLTLEILEACGFEYQHGQIEFYKNATMCMFWDGESLSANFGHIEQMDVEVNYLHQLQNLYFCLTGTELKYQP